MTPSNIITTVYFAGPIEPEDCRQLIEKAFRCSLSRLEGEKYEDDPPMYLEHVLGFKVLLSAQEEIWPEGRIYELVVLCLGQLIVPSAPTIGLEFHFASLLRHHNIQLVFDKPEYATEYRRREELESST